MGKVIIQEETTKNPISLIGKMAGVCWNGKDTPEANFKRGVDCLESEHGRTFEFPDVYMVIDGYSARLIRELYTHIGGSPTRLQESTRYIDYTKGFDFITPPSIKNNVDAWAMWNDTMEGIMETLAELKELGIPNEDISGALPLNMVTKIVCKYNLRTLLEMAKQRLCTRAYWEFRQLMKDILDALRAYSPEWAHLVDNYFVAKCEYYGYCAEKKSCGLRPKKSEIMEVISNHK